MKSSKFLDSHRGAWYVSTVRKFKNPKRRNSQKFLAIIELNSLPLYDDVQVRGILCRPIPDACASGVPDPMHFLTATKLSTCGLTLPVSQVPGVSLLEAPRIGAALAIWRPAGTSASFQQRLTATGASPATIGPRRRQSAPRLARR